MACANCHGTGVEQSFSPVTGEGLSFPCPVCDQKFVKADDYYSHVRLKITLGIGLGIFIGAILGSFV